MLSLPPDDQPSCSDDLSLSIPPTSGGDESGTRRARSTASNRISNFFGKDKTEMLGRLASLKEKSECRQSPMLKLEDHWTLIVKNHKDLSKRNIEQQEALWEIATTEKRYIQVLKHMEELHAYFVDLERLGYMKDIDAQRVFLNYSELYRCNLNFWKHSILPMLRNSRETGEPLRPYLLKPGFDDILEWSKCYIVFNFGHKESHCYVQKRQKDHEMFREFVSWAESQDTMRRQKLIDTLSTPMQRLTRYVLLLKAVLKATDDAEEKAVVQAMIDQTEAATMRLNFELNNNDLRLQLTDIAKTLEYDAVDNDEAVRVLDCYFDITRPMPYFPGPPRHRRPILRTDLKMREGRQGQKVETHCILFTDMLLICKAASKRNDRYRVIKPPMHVKDITARPFSDESGFYLASKNEFDAPTAFFLMFSSGASETRRWAEFITMANAEFHRMRERMFCGIMDIGVDWYRPLYESSSHFTTPDHSARLSFGGFYDNSLPTQLEIAHRKSSSMDSQVVAQAHAHLAHMRKSGTISSAEQLDRFRQDSPTRWIARGKHLTNGLHAASISQSKSSVDLYLPISATEIPDFEDCTHQRSRSNSSSGDIGIQPHTASHNRSDSSSLLSNGSAAQTPSDRPIPQRTRSPSFVITSTEDSPDVDLRHLVTPERDAKESPGTPCTSTPPVSEASSRACTPNTPPTTQTSTRRFEKRYHTADSSELVKPKSLSGIQGSIMKRFSFNVPNPLSGVAKKTSNRINEQHNRRNSQTSTLASSESFCSSTSGISSASSRDNNNVVSIDDGLDSLRDDVETLSLISDMTPCEEKRPEPILLSSKPHISTVAVGEQHSEQGEDTSTLRISLSSLSESGSSAPPLPVAPPPSQIPNGECKTFSKHQDLLKFIMENHLETSDV
ncbi:hypothetical protein L596_003071 [Steinernema carpocapsae]|nr:hypothetical protein L596_003071 [Steinernema carpocapsae]